MKISIITIVKNDEKNIENTIKSVLKQNYKKKQHIIIDGNSIDGTSQKIKKYSKYINHFRQNDKGIYDAINKGIKKADGDIICLLHSGDIFSEDNILTKVNKLFYKNYKIVTGNVLFYKSINKKIVITRIWKKKINFFNDKNFYLLPHTTLFLDKNILKKVGPYSLRYQIASDTKFILKLSQMNYKYIHLNKYITYMKIGGISTNVKYVFVKIIEDLKILYNYFGYIFLFIYLKKILSKLRGHFIKKHKKTANQLKKQLKELNEFQII